MISRYHEFKNEKKCRPGRPALFDVEVSFYCCRDNRAQTRVRNLSSCRLSYCRTCRRVRCQKLCLQRCRCRENCSCASHFFFPLWPFIYLSWIFTAALFIESNN